MNELDDNSNGDRNRPAGAVQSVDRALAVLEILARLGTAGVTEIADELGVHKSTASRLVAVLDSRGYVSQLKNRGKFRLGNSLVRLARTASPDGDLVRQSQELCAELAETVGESVNISILDGDRSVSVVKADGPSGVGTNTWVGQSSPAHATSSGKLLLSELSDAEIADSVGGSLIALTPRTITHLATLSESIATILDRGWAQSEEELEVGMNAVSVPIRDYTARVIAALSVSGPAYRLLPERFDEVARAALDTAQRISSRLGYAAP
ncbi:IclR family transcriptional regulator [Rhodococcus koreensis]|jgi:DNA-binding IclR family transcriptional regulator|uniref:Glycerol operon regulatory protein n=1 Tax=Rhodococcus koreensis TaxID=99653 RepID=A0A1H4ZGL4_9NOCA|nr:IclR family transcriptional regulator [Rhodococcus koreensis]QSE79328.1 IclR family transcriptional regulator [Rhodococcus koreensis]SED28788.1 DNA-binding transcriptional regulator, IclR family [Rhodococcus koreensis]